jgi:hypothetical protein
MRSNTTFLRLFDLPVISSLAEFCALIHLEEARIRLISKEAYRFYRRYEIPKKSGGMRQIRQPTQEVKAKEGQKYKNADSIAGVLAFAGSISKSQHHALLKYWNTITGRFSTRKEPAT